MPKYKKLFSNYVESEEVDSFNNSRMGETIEDTWHCNVDNHIDGIFSAEGKKMEKHEPVLEKVDSGPISGKVNSGPKKKLGVLVGLWSFDGACRNIVDSKINSKKSKLVEGLGEKVKIVPSFYDYLAPRSNNRRHLGLVKVANLEYEDILSSSSYMGNSMID